MKVITLQTVMTEITMRSEKYAIQKGDYVLYNGSSYQFCAADGRTLKTEGWVRYSYIRLTQKALKTIPLDKMRKTQSVDKMRKTQLGSVDGKVLLTKWYF